MSYLIQPVKRGRKKIIFWIVLSFFLLALAGLFYFGWKIQAVSEKINPEKNNSGSLAKSAQSVLSAAFSSQREKLSGEENGRINILLLGIAGENRPGKNLTDTVIIASIETEEKKVALLSLPRDLFVPVSGTNYSAKLNSVYQLGLNNGRGANLIKETVEDITNLDIHYYFILDFEGFEKIIDDIGGINIMAERDIYDARYPGPNYSYEVFEIKKGLHRLDGATALKYARVRHGDPEGDFGRAKRQQQVIQAAKNKIFSLQTFLNVFALNNLLNTLEKNLKTNVQTEEIESFIQLTKQLDTQNITTEVVDAWKKESLLKGSRLATNGGWLSVLVPRAGNWSEIQDLANNLFSLDVIRKRKAEIEKEAARVAIINQSGDAGLVLKIRDLVQNKLGIKNTAVLYYQIKPARSDTFLLDFTNKQKVFTLDELIKKIPAGLDDSGNFSGIIKEGDKERYDIILVLGQDLVERYSFEETSFDEWKKYEEEQE